MTSRRALAVSPALALFLGLPAEAAFVGWTAALRSQGGYVLLDVFAGVDVATQHGLNVFNMSVSASGATFFQAADARTWAPGAYASSTASLDSFVTLGGLSYGGTYYAATATAKDPNFSNYNTPNATTIPTNAGWYNTSPLSAEGDAVNLSVIQGAQWLGASAQHGVWVAHFAFVAASVNPGATVSFGGKFGYRDAGSQVALQGQDSRTFALPAPPALALLPLAGLGRRRSRRADGAPAPR